MYFIIPIFILLIYQKKSINPTYVGIIIFLTLIISIFPLSNIAINSIISYISFLILIGGLIVIFIYFSSFTERRSIKIGWNNLLNVFNEIILFLFFIFISWKILILLPSWSNSLDSISIFYLSEKNLLFESTNIIYTYLINVKIIFYLLIFIIICLTSIVKLCLIRSINIRKI